MEEQQWLLKVNHHKSRTFILLKTTPHRTAALRASAGNSLDRYSTNHRGETLTRYHRGTMYQLSRGRTLRTIAGKLFELSQDTSTSYREGAEQDAGSKTSSGRERQTRTKKNNQASPRENRPCLKASCRRTQDLNTKTRQIYSNTSKTAAAATYKIEAHGWTYLILAYRKPRWFLASNTYWY